MKLSPNRILNFCGFVICGLLLAAAYYMQYVLGVQPCPLCTLQRLAFILLALNLLVATLHNPRKMGSRIYGLITLLFAFCGVLLAWRHIWLQLHPAATTDICVPGFEYVMTHLPPMQIVQFLLQSSENCSRVSAVWGVSIPVWTLIGFAAFCLLAGVQVVFASSLCRKSCNIRHPRRVPRHPAT